MIRGGIDTDTASSTGQSAESEIEAEHPIDDMKFKELQNEILQAMQNNPDLDPLTENVIFEQTPEGLHIQIIDQEGKPMFYNGRAEMAGATETLIGNLGKSLAQLPNRIVLSGHTDAVPFANNNTYDNWDLSSDRANATRRVFEASGVTRDRIIRVSGMADTQLLVPEKPKDPSNRRISIMVQYRTDDQSPPPIKEAETEMQGTDAKDEQATTNYRKTNIQETQHASDHSTLSAERNRDKVLENLRNALR